MALEVLLDRNMASGTMAVGLKPASGPSMGFFKAASVFQLYFNCACKTCDCGVLVPHLKRQPESFRRVC
jgi:hypothetical protein